ncbi:MAG TPA: HesA/MoeB/ThiF family protein [bacterium]|nr:HesA/MoeB/ThiF family protein [bacterium]HOL47122.1 HesA/MoeB/ThiF family protein [bacterium]HPQ18876.1 HesA/MoeB/ThiF family protein [bacterium]
MKFTEEQIERYSRQIILNEIGGNGQQKLLNSKVLIIGCGGLGSPAAYYLAAAGIGFLGLLDSDNAELSNLNRQILHFTKDVGKPKVKSAEEKIRALNPDVNIKIYHNRINSTNILEIIKDYDFIIDGSDNFPTKFLINDACVLAKKAYSHAGVLRFEGQSMTYVPEKSACYRCLFPEPPPQGLIPNCQQAGILGTVAGFFGLIQATEAIKYLLGFGELLSGKLLNVNLLTMEARKINIKKNNNCLICGQNRKIDKLIDYELICEVRKEENEK